MAKNTEAMQKARREKADATERYVLDVIREMKKNKEKISFYGVAKRTGSSRTYLYNNEKICRAIKGVTEKVQHRSEESTAALLKAARMRIRSLEAEVAALKSANGDTYKEKYEKLREENRQLKEQLTTAYKY